MQDQIDADIEVFEEKENIDKYESVGPERVITVFID